MIYVDIRERAVRNLHHDLADLICYGVDQKRWLAEEASDLATTIADLDEIPSQAILPLAQLVAGGESDVQRLASTLNMCEGRLNEYLDALCEFGFAEETWNGYKATETGEQVLDAVGRKMVARELFEMKSRLQKLESLCELHRLQPLV